MKSYNDWLEDFKETITKWEHDFYLTREFATKRCIELIKTLNYVPYMYKNKLEKDLIEWSRINGKTK